jgi:hypothetical protein
VLVEEQRCLKRNRANTLTRMARRSSQSFSLNLCNLSAAACNVSSLLQKQKRTCCAPRSGTL